MSAELVAGTWTVDAAQAHARFRARDVLRKTVVGSLTVLSGSVEVSPDGTPRQVSAVLDLTSVETGSARRDADLRGARFFDVEQQALLHVSAGPALPDGPDRWLLPASLRLRGVSCPLSLDVELVDLGEGRARVRAAGVLDRRDAGITVPRVLVGREVSVEVEAVLQAPATAGRPRSTRCDVVGERQA